MRHRHREAPSIRRRADKVLRTAILVWVAIPVLILLAGCWPRPVLVEYCCAGGLAGVDIRLRVYQDSHALLEREAGGATSSRLEFELTEVQLRWLKRQLSEAGFGALKGEYLPGDSRCDRFEYLITYRGRTVRTMDGAIPAALEEVISVLEAIVQGKQVFPRENNPSQSIVPGGDRLLPGI